MHVGSSHRPTCLVVDRTCAKYRNKSVKVAGKMLFVAFVYTVYIIYCSFKVVFFIKFSYSMVLFRRLRLYLANEVDFDLTLKKDTAKPCCFSLNSGRANHFPR